MSYAVLTPASSCHLSETSRLLQEPHPLLNQPKNTSPPTRVNPHCIRQECTDNRKRPSSPGFSLGIRSNTKSHSCRFIRLPAVCGPAPSLGVLSGGAPSLPAARSTGIVQGSFLSRIILLTRLRSLVLHILAKGHWFDMPLYKQAQI